MSSVAVPKMVTYVFIGVAAVIILTASTVGSYYWGWYAGRDYVANHVDKYVSIPKPVTYNEAEQFIKEDGTNTYLSTEDPKELHDITSAAKLKDHANARGIRCAVAWIDYINPQEVARGGSYRQHIINAIDTTDRGVVYVEPLYDMFVDNVRVGELYDVLYHKAYLASEKLPDDNSYGSSADKQAKIIAIKLVW